uniref:Uncharacterized protein n=1 Tax=Lepeophtheirus salmonis TaxID=72036 RepID=A0A0K2TAA0_LEPSM
MSFAMENIDFFHCWCQKWPLYPHKALSTHFLIALWTVWFEIPRYLVWTLLDWRGLAWAVFYNCCGSSSLNFMKDTLFLSNV